MKSMKSQLIHLGRYIGTKVAKSLLLGNVCLLALSAHAADSNPIKMYILDCGTIKVSNMDVFSSSGDYANQQETLTSSCFLIRHPKGDLLWDTGLAANLVGAKPLVNGVFSLTMKKTLTQQLKTLGLTPRDIDFVSLSHSHFDHVGQLSSFNAATWLVDERELAAMVKAKDSLANFTQIEKMQRSSFKGDFDVFGDGRVMILPMPGHTTGHTVLQLKLAQAGPVLLSGDLYHQAKSRTLKRVPRFNANEQQTRTSMARFETIAAKLGATVIIQHEKSQIDKLPKLPNFIE